ncbi:MAG: cytochrome D ubiquinol oxidase subunit I [Alphaproteobacteria bacterium]|nr:cytochrome D ubiquinol oxidase subunit I [Alphaproteobacteria bacterium]
MPPPADGLDPADWAEFSALAHRMLDDMIGYLRDARDRPVWQPMPAELRAELRTPLPHAGEGAAAAYADFTRLVVPYATGNTHPGFMGWVHGGGTAVGMMAELLAGALNANLGGRDHAPIEVERQVLRWAAEMLGFPLDASGLLVTGTSIANMIGVLVARTHALGPAVRRTGLQGAPLVAYAAGSVHGCIPRAMEMCGLGLDALHMVPTDAEGRMALPALAAAIAADRAEGRAPFLVVGTAGTVDIGAIDDLAAIAAIARREGIWFHADGAFGALAMLAPALRGKLAGIEQADSVAFDFHKWAQVPYDAGCILVRHAGAQAATFASEAAYLRRETRGLAAGTLWPCDLGPDLSRGFRALKVWLTLKAYGADRIGAVVQESCDLANRLAARVEAEPELERLAPVPLNIVCFRYRAPGLDGAALDELNREIVADLHEMGLAAPSTTVLGGRLAIRAALVNHRITDADTNAMLDGVLARGRARTGRNAPAGGA